MINATRSVLPSQKPILLYNNIGRRTISAFSFRQKQEKSNESEKQQQEKQPDVNAHSFGEGYATRSDEEGFGGTNASALDGNDAAIKIQQDKMIHENHPVYDKTQGSEVAETEKGRHQKTSS